VTKTVCFFLRTDSHQCCIGLRHLSGRTPRGQDGAIEWSQYRNAFDLWAKGNFQLA